MNPRKSPAAATEQPAPAAAKKPARKSPAAATEQPAPAAAKKPARKSPAAAAKQPAPATAKKPARKPPAAAAKQPAPAAAKKPARKPPTTTPPMDPVVSEPHARRMVVSRSRSAPAAAGVPPMPLANTATRKPRMPQRGPAAAPPPPVVAVAAAPLTFVASTVEFAELLSADFQAYAEDVIVDRALPDVRDGLKPVQRRILYVMHELGVRHDAPHRKCARIVGDVLGKYHPHGDSGVYGALVRLAQPFQLRVPLVDGQGNFGDGDDGAAAYRYTEARMTPATEAMLEDIDMDTVPWEPNFDQTLREPTLLPGRFPNLLVNGTTGIAVGMASSMPPHNVGEVCAAVVHMAQNWTRRTKITVEDLMQFIPGPDFPTGGLLYRWREESGGGERTDALRAAYETGAANVTMQAQVNIESHGGGKSQIVISALPYGVSRGGVMKAIADGVKVGNITGLTDVRDETDREGVRVVCEVSRQASPPDVLAAVLRYTDLRKTYRIANIALVPTAAGATCPRTLSLHALLEHFVAYRLLIIERRSRYELDRRRARLHIVEGLLKCLDVLDEVIALIRRSKTPDTARANLVSQFKFSDLQAQAILDMQLRRLTALERNKLVEEQRELQARIKYLEGLLRSEAKRLEVVIGETKEISTTYATPRRTVIVEGERGSSGFVVTQADLVVPAGPQLLVLTPDGVTRTAADGFSFKVGKGLSKRGVGAEETHLRHVLAQPTDTVLLVSNQGRGWLGEVGFVPTATATKELGLARGERIVAADILREEDFLLLGTKQGRVKRTRVADLGLLRRQWGPVIGLKEDDEVLFATCADDTAHVLFYTAGGQILRFESSTVSAQQTPSATGVAGMGLKGQDYLLGGFVVPAARAQEQEWQIIVVSTTGYAHRAALAEFPVQGRGGGGVRTLRPTKSGGIVGGIASGKHGPVDVYLADGRRQRLALSEIPAVGRDALGMRAVASDRGSVVTRVVAWEV